jgi:hypothetical protein
MVTGQSPVAVRPHSSARSLRALPHRIPTCPQAGRQRFRELAVLTRSAQELLTVTLQRPVTVRPVGNQVVALPGVPSVRIVEHELYDGPRRVGFTAATVAGARLPEAVRCAARRGESTLAELLDRAGDYWAAELLRIEPVPAAPAVRLTRRLTLLTTPVALVVDEILLPDPTVHIGPAPGGTRSPPG